MFYLRNASINPADIFPRDMPEKLCANFTCKEKECNNTNCNYAHPRKHSELKHETIMMIANHFIKKDVGWLNEYHSCENILCEYLYDGDLVFVI